MRRIFDIIAGSILVAAFAVVLGIATICTLKTLYPPSCELHIYTVIRINPSLDPLLVPTLSTGNNPRLIFTEMMACGYEHIDGKTVFYTDERRDTIDDVVHIQDQGPIQ